jgi:hypothetical protein
MFVFDLFNNKGTVSEAGNRPEPEQEIIDATRRARLQSEREPAGSENIDAMLAQQHAQLQQYEQSGKFWLKTKVEQKHIQGPFVGKATANAAAIALLKQAPELKGNLVITAYGPEEQQNVEEGSVLAFEKDPFERWKKNIGMAYPNLSPRLKFVSKDNGNKVVALDPVTRLIYGEFETQTMRGRVSDVADNNVAEVASKQRLDPKCWTGKKIGNPKTKMKGGVRVNNCVPAESVEEGSVTKKPQPYNDPNWAKNLPKEKLDALAGPRYKKDKKEQGVAEDDAGDVDERFAVKMDLERLKSGNKTTDGIGMQDIRLVAGEGKLTKSTVLQALTVIRKQRGDQGVAEGYKEERLKGCKCQHRQGDNKKCPIHGVQEGVAEGSETPEKEIERLKLRQNAEHGRASLKRQAETQARIRELEKAQKNQGVAEGEVIPFARKPQSNLTWQQLPKDVLKLANDWFWADDDDSSLAAVLDPKGYGSGTRNDVQYIAAQLQQRGWTIDHDLEDNRPGEFNLKLTNKRGQSVLLPWDDARNFTGWAQGTNSNLREGSKKSIDPNFVGFMNKTMANQVDKPKVDPLANAPTWYKNAPAMNFSAMPSHKKALQFGLAALSKLDPATGQQLAIKGEAAIVSYLLKAAKQTKVRLGFVEEDLWECQDYLSDVFHDPNINSWVDVLKQNVTEDAAGVDVAEATGDVKFDKMLKGITGKKEVAKQQKIDTKQQARDAFGGMFGGGNPADKLSIRKKGVAEGGFKNMYAEFSGYGNYMQGRAVNVFNKAGLEIVSKEYSEDDDIQTYVVKGDRWAIEKAGKFLERNAEQFGGYHFVKQGVSENYPKHQDLSSISTDKLKAYLAKQAKQSVPGEGSQVKRVQAELQRRSQGVAEGGYPEVDHMPGPTIKRTQTGCKRCHGKGYVYKTPDGETHPMNRPDAKKYKCGKCNGIGFVKVTEQGVAEGSEEDYKNQRMWDQHDDDTEDLGIISQGEYWAGIHRNKQRQLDKEQQKKDMAEAGYSGVDDTDTVGFSVNSERAYQAVMSRFGNQVDHDETSGTMYVPARLWPQVEMIAFDADGEGASRDDEGIAEGTIADQPRIRKYSKIRADGSKAERYEVLDYQGRRVAGQGAEGFDDLKYAKEFFKRNYNRLINPMDEDVLTAKTKKKEKNDSKNPGKKMLESKKRYWCSIEKRWKETDENKESN